MYGKYCIDSKYIHSILLLIYVLQILYCSQMSGGPWNLQIWDDEKFPDWKIVTNSCRFVCFILMCFTIIKISPHKFHMKPKLSFFKTIEGIIQYFALNFFNYISTVFCLPISLEKKALCTIEQSLPCFA